MGVASVVLCNCCPFLGVGVGAAAWVMGGGDLATMEAREMDPAGRSNTHAGRVCGMVGVGLGLAYAVVVALQMAFFFARGGP